MDEPGADRSRLLTFGWRARASIALHLGEATFPILIVVGTTVALTTLPLSADVSWQLWIAHHLLSGARLYSDIVEVNPPLWYWMAVPIDWLANLAGINATPLLVIATGLSALYSMIATDRLLERLGTPHRALIVSYAAIMLIVVTLADTGQREQLALIAALPYCALAALRRQQIRVPWVAAATVGGAAALGFALKHYFLIVPLLLEIWLLSRSRRAWRPLRPETIALFVIGAIYGAAVLAFTPDYLTIIVPMLRLAYGDAGVHSWLILVQPLQLIWLLTALFLVSQIRNWGTQPEPFMVSLLIGALGFGAAWAIQHKGWEYQAIATSGCLMLALAVATVRNWRRASPSARVMAAALLSAPVLFAIMRGPYSEIALDRESAPVVSGLDRGDSVAFITPEPSFSWPLTLNEAYRYPMRFYGLWMMNAVVYGQRHSHDPRLAALGRKVAFDTSMDFDCIQPDRIAFDRRDHRIDTWLVFFQDPLFSRVMSHYQLSMRTDSFDVYQRVSRWPVLYGSLCRRGV